jgi:hypothetical protein
MAFLTFMDTFCDGGPTLYVTPLLQGFQLLSVTPLSMTFGLEETWRVEVMPAQDIFVP